LSWVFGIGFVAVLTGAVAERFLASRIDDAQDEVREEVEDAGADLLDELREIQERLKALERRLASSPAVEASDPVV
jgi:hypothetical protein